MVTAMQLIIEPGGAVRCIYSEEIDLAALGSPAITRASHVEPDQQGRWRADLSPVNGPGSGTIQFPQRGPGGRARLAGDQLARPPGRAVAGLRFDFISPYSRRRLTE